MFSITFMPYYDATEKKIREVFESLHLGEFSVVILPPNPLKKGTRVFINYTTMTEESAEFRNHLMENEIAQKQGTHITPVKIYYESYLGKERYWKVYLAKSPYDPFTPFTPRIEYPFGIGDVL